MVLLGFGSMVRPDTTGTLVPAMAFPAPAAAPPLPAAVSPPAAPPLPAAVSPPAEPAAPVPVPALAPPKPLGVAPAPAPSAAAMRAPPADGDVRALLALAPSHARSSDGASRASKAACASVRWRGAQESRGSMRGV